MGHRQHKAMISGTETHKWAQHRCWFCLGPLPDCNTQMGYPHGKCPWRGGSRCRLRQRSGRWTLWGGLLGDGHWTNEEPQKSALHPPEIVSKYKAEMGRVTLWGLAESNHQMSGGDDGSEGGTVWGDTRILSWLLMVFNHPCNFQAILVRIYLNIDQSIAYHSALHPQTVLLGSYPTSLFFF